MKVTCYKIWLRNMLRQFLLFHKLGIFYHYLISITSKDVPYLLVTRFDSWIPLANHESIFCLYGFAYCGHFMYASLYTMWCCVFDIFTEHYESKVYPCINTAFPLMAEELYYVDRSHFICLLLSDETFRVCSLFVNVYRYPCAGIWSGINFKFTWVYI